MDVGDSESQSGPGLFLWPWVRTGYSNMSPNSRYGPGVELTSILPHYNRAEAPLYRSGLVEEFAGRYSGFGNQSEVSLSRHLQQDLHSERERLRFGENELIGMTQIEAGAQINASTTAGTKGGNSEANKTAGDSASSSPLNGSNFHNTSISAQFNDSLQLCHQREYPLTGSLQNVSELLPASPLSISSAPANGDASRKGQVEKAVTLLSPDSHHQSIERWHPFSSQQQANCLLAQSAFAARVVRNASEVGNRSAYVHERLLEDVYSRPNSFRLGSGASSTSLRLQGTEGRRDFFSHAVLAHMEMCRRDELETGQTQRQAVHSRSSTGQPETNTDSPSAPYAHPTRGYKCKLCQHVCYSRHDLSTHNTSIHKQEARPYRCDQCGRQFSTCAYLSQHRRIHSGIKPYACRYCDRKFTQLSHLQQHERIHTGEKPYKCMACFKSFTQMSNLQSHQRQHMKGKPNRCERCFMSYDKKDELDIHIQAKHAGNKYAKVLVCPKCSKSYNSETYLAKHMERHKEAFTTGKTDKKEEKQSNSDTEDMHERAFDTRCHTSCRGLNACALGCQSRRETSSKGSYDSPPPAHQLTSQPTGQAFQKVPASEGPTTPIPDPRQQKKAIYSLSGALPGEEVARLIRVQSERRERILDPCGRPKELPSVGQLGDNATTRAGRFWPFVGVPFDENELGPEASCLPGRDLRIETLLSYALPNTAPETGFPSWFSSRQAAECIGSALEAHNQRAVAFALEEGQKLNPTNENGRNFCKQSTAQFAADTNHHWSPLYTDKSRHVCRLGKCACCLKKPAPARSRDSNFRF